MAQVFFFGLPDEEGSSQQEMVRDMFSHIGKHALHPCAFDARRAYRWQDELHGLSGRPPDAGPLARGDEAPHYGREWALLLMDKPVVALPGSVTLATKLDMHQDAVEPDCRILFYGNIVQTFAKSEEHKNLRLYKTKWREGVVDRVDANTGTVIIKNMFKKETALSAFIGMKVVAESGVDGILQQAFAKSGKVKAEFSHGMPSGAGSRVVLRFKRFVFDDKQKMAQ